MATEMTQKEYMKNGKLTEEQLKQWEYEFNQEPLRKQVKYKNIIIKTVGELRKIANTTEKLEKFFDFIDEMDYHAIYREILLKELKDQNKI